MIINVKVIYVIFFLFFICLIIVLYENNYKEKIYKKMFDQEKMKRIFSDIYYRKAWGNGSGPGSYKECTGDYLKFLYNFINSRSITSITDLGCGDWQMLKHFYFTDNITYYGYDVVRSIIEEDKKLYEKENIKFYYLENISKMKIADLLIVKDVLIHWKNEIIIFFLKNIMKKYRYTILVNGFIDGEKNVDIKVGKFRVLNLEISPFNYTHFEKHIDMFFCKKLKRIYINKISI